MQTLRSHKGFSLLESLVAVSMLAVVAVVVTQLVHKNIVTGFWNGQMKKAAGLADQVFEKYDYLASVQFATLEQLNQTHAKPESFFATGNDAMGYEKMWLTTVVDSPISTGSRKLTVTVSWGDEGPGKSITFTKFLSAAPGDQGGAPVHVYVVDENGNGISGFEVRAAHHTDPSFRNAMGTNEVIGFTDNAGFVTLHNVSVDPLLQPMAIYAQKPGSHVTVTKSDTANFIQGYYAPGHSSWNTKNLTLTQTTANVLQFDLRQGDFFPLKSLSGTLHNANNGPTAGMNLSLQGWLSDGDTLLQKTVTQQTLAGGAYEFNNLGPGTLTLTVTGRSGSVPTVQTTDPMFILGYGGTGGNGSRPWIYQTTMADPAVDIPTYNVSVRALGSLSLTTKNTSGVSVGGVTVVINSAYQFPNWGYPMTQTSDGSGRLELSNLFAGSGEAITYDSYKGSSDCSQLGYYLYSQVVSADADTSNVVPLALKNGGSLTGMVYTSGVPTEGMPNVQVTAKSLVPGGTVTAVTGSGAGSVGQFTLCGVSPEVSTINPSWPSIELTLADSSRKIVADMSGRMLDRDTGALLINQPISIAANLPAGGFIHDRDCASDVGGVPVPVSDPIQTNASGLYGPICAYMPWQTTAFTASIGGVQSVVVSTSTTQGGLQAIPSNSYYYHAGEYLTVAQGGTYSLDLRPVRRRQRASGVVTEFGSGRTLQGITVQYACQCTGAVCDTNLTCSTTTDASGAYGPVDVNISDRISAAQGGLVTLQTPDGATSVTTGGVYKGSIMRRDEGALTVPTTPMVINFTLNKYTGGI